MTPSPFRPFDAILVLLAVPLWLLLIIEVPRSTGFGHGNARYLIAPVVLLGTAAAIWYPLRTRRHAAAVALLISGILTGGSLLLAALLAD